MIPQIPKPLTQKSKWAPIKPQVQPLAQSEVNDTRAELRELHIKFKAFRKNPPEDCREMMWALSLCKVLDEILDEYFKRVDA